MRHLVAKYPDGYEGWANARGEKIAAAPVDSAVTDAPT